MISLYLTARTRVKMLHTAVGSLLAGCYLSQACVESSKQLQLQLALSCKAAVCSVWPCAWH